MPRIDERTGDIVIRIVYDGMPDQAALNAFGVKWGVEFLGPPMSPHELPTE